MHTFLEPRLLLAGAAAALLAVPSAAVAAPVKLAATLSGGTSADPDGSGTFTAEVDADLGDFCYTLNLAKLGKVTGAAVHAAGSPDPLVKLEISGASADECIAAEPSVLKPIVENPANYAVTVRTSDFPAGAVQGALARK